MNTNSYIILLSTDVGMIAISVEDFVVGRHTADGLLGTHGGSPPNEMTQKPLVSAEKVAELFGMDATWFLTRARENRLPHIRMGKYVRFDPDEIRNFFHREADRHAN